MTDFGVLNWTIVVLFLVASLGIGWAMKGRIADADDYYLGDRSAPWWAIGISVLATYVSALSFLGAPAWAYGDGMAALAIHINYALVVFVCIVYFIPFFHDSGVASIYEYLERRFGVASRATMGVVFMVTTILGAASILTATAIVVDFATGLGTGTAIALITVIVVAYTMLGGMNAVIWTDVLQGAILTVGAVVVLVSVMARLESMPEALRFLAERGRFDPIDTSFDLSVAPTIWAGIVAMTFYHITVYGANQYMVQRVLAAKSIGDAKKSYMLMGYAAFFLYFAFFLIGALLYAYYRGRPFEQPNAIILVFAESLAIPGLLGLIAAAILSASMSTTSSALNSLATITVTDFYRPFFARDRDERHYLRMSRLFTVVWGLAVVPVAFGFVASEGSILEVLSRVASYFVGAKLAMFGAGFFSRAIGERGLLLGVAAGFLAVMAIAPPPGLDAGIEMLWQAAGWKRPEIAWPWLPLIGGGVNLVVARLASPLMDGPAREWHPYSVPGRKLLFAADGRAEQVDGWFLVPGRVEPVVWTLPAFFVVSLLSLAWFGTLA